MNDKQRETSNPRNRLAGLVYDAIVILASTCFMIFFALEFPNTMMLVMAGVLGWVMGSAILRDDIQPLALAIKRMWVKRKPAEAKELAVSLTYLIHLKRQHSRTKYALLGCAVAFVALSYRFPDLGLLTLAATSIAFLGLITLKELLIAYRIRKGLFGTNRVEARDLINFIVKNSSDIDFADSNGKLRRVLLPEESDARDAALGTAHTGATA